MGASSSGQGSVFQCMRSGTWTAWVSRGMRSGVSSHGGTAGNGGNGGFQSGQASWWLPGDSTSAVLPLAAAAPPRGPTHPRIPPCPSVSLRSPRFLRVNQKRDFPNRHRLVCVHSNGCGRTSLGAHPSTDPSVSLRSPRFLRVNQKRDFPNRHRLACVHSNGCGRTSLGAHPCTDPSVFHRSPPFLRVNLTKPEARSRRLLHVKRCWSPTRTGTLSANVPGVY